MGRGLFTRTDVIDGAPAALNTLNEIAAAIGDDAGFITTITGLISARETPAGAQTKATTAQAAAIAASQPVSAALTKLAAAPVVLTPAAAPATNAALGTVFDLAIAENATMAAPTSPVDGQRITYRITQTGAGIFTVAWDAVFKFGATIAVPVIAVGLGVTSIVGFVYSATAVKWNVVEVALGV